MACRATRENRRGSEPSTSSWEGTSVEVRSVKVTRHKPSLQPTLHDVIVPAVGELSILPTHIQATQVDLVRLAVLELDELAQPREELGVAVGAVLVGQDGNLIVALGHRDMPHGTLSASSTAPAPDTPSWDQVIALTGGFMQALIFSAGN